MGVDDGCLRAPNPFSSLSQTNRSPPVFGRSASRKRFVSLGMGSTLSPKSGKHGGSAGKQAAAIPVLRQKTRVNEKTTNFKDIATLGKSGEAVEKLYPSLHTGGVAAL